LGSRMLRTQGSWESVLWQARQQSQNMLRSGGHPSTMVRKTGAMEHRTARTQSESGSRNTKEIGDWAVHSDGTATAPESLGNGTRNLHSGKSWQLGTPNWDEVNNMWNMHQEWWGSVLTRPSIRTSVGGLGVSGGGSVLRNHSRPHFGRFEVLTGSLQLTSGSKEQCVITFFCSFSSLTSVKTVGGQTQLPVQVVGPAVIMFRSSNSRQFH